MKSRSKCIEYILRVDPPHYSDEEDAVSQLERLSVRQLASICEDLGMLTHHSRAGMFDPQVTHIYGSRRDFVDNLREMHRAADDVRRQLAEETRLAIGR